MDGKGRLYDSVALIPGKENSKFGGQRNLSGRLGENLFLLLGFEFRIVVPLA